MPKAEEGWITFETRNSTYIYRVVGTEGERKLLEVRCQKGARAGKTYRGDDFMGLPEAGKRFVLYNGDMLRLSTSKVAEVRPHDEAKDGPVR